MSLETSPGCDVTQLVWAPTDWPEEPGCYNRMAMASPPELPTQRYVRDPVALDFPTGGEVPETKLHLELRTALYLILKHGLGDHAMIGCDQFVYWDPTDPSECLSPDAFVRVGTPDELFGSWKIWERGAPHVAVEIISDSDAAEADWQRKLSKYRRTGISEVVRFDPAGPELRVWDNVGGDLVERELPPGEPVRCVPLALFWVVAQDESLGSMLRLAQDREGERLLPTPREEALERVRLLEAELARRG